MKPLKFEMNTRALKRSPRRAKEDVLGSKTLGTKCIRTSICNVLANHDQNLESRLRLLKVYLFVKLETSDCGIYWSKFARLDR